MSAEWKPGDVAMSVQGRVMRCSFAYGKGAGWVYDDASGSPGNNPGGIRPLVVIDPEDREAVERLAKALHLNDVGEGKSAPWDSQYPSWRSDRVDEMQAALREFAAPTPPRPEEPTGLGAVVEDEDGNKWVRSPESDDDTMPWLSAKGGWRLWVQIAAVRILSPGVEVAQ